MITRYRAYLDFLDNKLQGLFEGQKPYIKCKKGCAYCCREGEFPISELEFVNMLFYYNELEDSIKDKINENISSLILRSRERLYECPFLIDNKCSIYPARPIICRTFGLLTYFGKENKKIPFCVDLDLNYSDVYDKTEGVIIGKSSDGIEPAAYNVDRRFLRNQRFEKEFNIFFGEDKPMVEFLKEEFSP